MFDGRLRDEAIDGAADGKPRLPEVEMDLRRGRIGSRSLIQAVEGLAPEVLAEEAEIPFRRGALEDFQARDGADAEGNAAIEDLAESPRRGRIVAFEIIDQDGCIDEDHCFTVDAFSCSRSPERAGSSPGGRAGRVF
jgi:hypothetical protein